MKKIVQTLKNIFKIDKKIEDNFLCRKKEIGYLHDKELGNGSFNVAIYTPNKKEKT